MNRLGIVLWALFAIPTKALILTVVISRLWRWFLSAQYGDGPSFGAWFGAAVIISISTWHPSVKDFEDGSDANLRTCIAASLSTWTILVLTMLLAFAVGSIFGWVR
jgi:hypothetical protein